MADIRRQPRAWLAAMTTAPDVPGGACPGSGTSEAVIDPAAALAIRRMTVARSGARISRRITSALEPLRSGNGGAPG
jgi:hypothetical protein